MHRPIRYQRKNNRRNNLSLLLAYSIIVLFSLLSIDAAMYASSINILSQPTAGGTGNINIDSYNFIVQGVVFGNETGIIPNTTIGSFAIGVRVEANVYSDFHNITTEIYNDGILEYSTSWNNVYINSSINVLVDYFTPGFTQGSEVHVRIAAEEN